MHAQLNFLLTVATGFNYIFTYINSVYLFCGDLPIKGEGLFVKEELWIDG